MSYIIRRRRTASWHAEPFSTPSFPEFSIPFFNHISAHSPSNPCEPTLVSLAVPGNIGSVGLDRRMLPTPDTVSIESPWNFP